MPSNWPLQTWDDGGTAIGLRYGSKHGNDWICWAIWIRDGLDRMTAVDDGAAVEPPERNPVLAKVRIQSFGRLVIQVR